MVFLNNFEVSNIFGNLQLVWKVWTKVKMEKVLQVGSLSVGSWVKSLIMLLNRNAVWKSLKLLLLLNFRHCETRWRKPKKFIFWDNLLKSESVNVQHLIQCLILLKKAPLMGNSRSCKVSQSFGTVQLVCRTLMKQKSRNLQLEILEARILRQTV